MATDIAAYAAIHEEGWARLAALTRRRRLSGAQIDELIALYQSTATQLSYLQSVAPGTVLTARLSRLLAAARTRLTGAPVSWTGAVARFAVVSLPAALYRLRWWFVTVSAVSLALAAVVGVWFAQDPGLRQALAPESTIRRLVEHDFVDYYSNHPAESFALQVWTNNAWVAAQCVAFGVTGLLPAWALAQNAVNIGVNAGAMFAYGRGDVFFVYILPHGLLELTAVFFAAAAGLRLFWAWVEPGPRTRAASLAEEGRALFTVALGLAVVLAVSGAVEGFVTPSGLWWPVRIGIGVLVWAAFLAYVLVLGRRAAAAGETGDLDRSLTGERLPTAG